MADDRDSLLEARAVSVVIDNQVLLPETSLCASEGEAVAIRGQNGAGKTTLLRVLGGLTSPSSGQVKLRGEQLSTRKASHRAAIAAMIGSPPFARDLTLREQLRFVRATWGDSAEAGEATGYALLDDFNITPLAERYTHELSSGQLQLFSLALTLSRPCDVYLLDEPEQRLDASRRALVATAIRRRLTDGIGVVFATHDAALVDAVGAQAITVGEPV
ncbi:ABC transporter ATP-binding protein [Microbacterium sp. NPDC076911]|uniref:ABC transporter ATP-binding protein n=1 Tax=Microbacterium sp. NPDC076911 TaxID=3154958 RepID=UPI00341D0D5E